VLFPRLALPLASMMVSSVDFLIQSVILLFMLFYFKIAPTSTVLLLPAFLVILILTAFGRVCFLEASISFIAMSALRCLCSYRPGFFFLRLSTLSRWCRRDGDSSIQSIRCRKS
jgi:hypothetical protein